MTVDEIYSDFGQTLYNSIPDEEWKTAHLFIMRLENTARFNANYVNNLDEKIAIKARNFSPIYDSVHELHTVTTEGGHNRWNKLEFTLYPNFKFNLEFIWDQELQDEVDGYNNELKA